MSKLLKDPYELYGESKLRHDDRYYHEKAPDYYSVRKALRFKRAFWMVPSAIGFTIVTWAIIAAGMEAVIITGIFLSGTALAFGIGFGLNWLIDKSIDVSTTLRAAKNYGISEEPQNND